jgi:hypothetical protein
MVSRRSIPCVSDTKLTDLSTEAIASDHPASVLSELVAESAAIQSEAPYRTRNLFVPLPRAAASAGWEQTVEALDSAPWIAPTGVDELLDSPSESRGLLRTPFRSAADPGEGGEVPGRDARRPAGLQQRLH